MNELGLCEVALAGFEVFDELIRLPLRRLTFLFGPNSAGKSAVEDALKILSEVCYTGEYTEKDWYARGAAINSFDTGPDARRQRLEGAWHRRSGGPEAYASSMRLGASFIIDELQWHHLREEAIRLGEDQHVLAVKAAKAAEGIHRLELMVRFRRENLDWKKTSRSGLGRVLRDITFLLDGEPYLEFAEDAEIKLNLNHPVLLGLQVPESCKRAARLHPNHVVEKEGWLCLRGQLCIDDRKKLDTQLFVMGWIHGGFDFGEESSPSPDMHAALHDVADIINGLLTNACRCVSEALRPYVVPASRRVPEPGELTFLISDSSKGPVKSISTFPVMTAGDPAYHPLACSFACRAVGGESYGYELKVNRMLTDALFLERGYQLVADCRILVTPEQFKGGCARPVGDDPSNIASENLPVLVAMHLQDAQGRRHDFTQVGSGLGYVLPVLAALSDHHLMLVIVQQPELHLHPALQAALGDVFIELSHREPSDCCRVHPRFLIETHSEHLLLRVLRRLRQTGAEKCSDPDLQVRPEDVSILYFDPKPDGTTKVKQLRVAPDGEFMDRWPRGFFTERYEELFDE